ncbi:MAG TPA: metal-sulfur cluster assembly factor [Sphingobacteriaceae bacterium]
MNFDIKDPFFSEKVEAVKALSNVIDPELFVNIIDLGLVYDIDFSSAGLIKITMTLSTPHCPLREAIESGVKNVLTIFPDRIVDINVVWAPVWTVDMITEQGKSELGIE